MHLALEAVPVDALPLKRPDHLSRHPVLLWAVRGDELLFHDVAAHQLGVVVAGEHQTVVRAQQEGGANSPKRHVTSDQGGRGHAGLPVRESFQPRSCRVLHRLSQRSLRAFDEAMLEFYSIDHWDAGVDEYLLACYTDLPAREAALAFGEGYDLNRMDPFWSLRRKK